MPPANTLHKCRTIGIMTASTRFVKHIPPLLPVSTK